MVRLVGEHRTQLHGAASATAICNKAALNFLFGFSWRVVTASNP